MEGNGASQHSVIRIFAAYRMFASPAKLPEYILFKFPSKAEEDVSAHRCCPLRSAQVHELSRSYLLFNSSSVTKLSFFFQLP